MVRYLCRIASVCIGVAVLLAGSCAARAQIQTYEHGMWVSTAVQQPDGKVLKVGWAVRTDGNRTSGYDFGIFRLNTDGTTLDPTFNGGNVLRVPAWGYYEGANSILLQADGRIVIGGGATDPAANPVCGYGDCGVYAVLFRLLADAAIDPTFNAGVPLILQIGDVGPPEQGNGRLDALRLQPDGRIVILGPTGIRGAELARVNNDGTLDTGFSGPFHVRPAQFVPVIEYYNAALDHYFMTADRTEFAALDRGVFGGWARTYQAFHAWPAGTQSPPSAQPVCRVYGNPAQGLNTHFYSLNYSECEDLTSARYVGAWLLEGRDVFRVGAPDSLTGACRAGEVPVYRLWNRRVDTNHRFTASAQIRDEMVAKGYVLEGFGADGVMLCGAP